MTERQPNVVEAERRLRMMVTKATDQWAMHAGARATVDDRAMLQQHLDDADCTGAGGSTAKEERWSPAPGPAWSWRTTDVLPAVARRTLIGLGALGSNPGPYVWLPDEREEVKTAFTRWGEDCARNAVEVCRSKLATRIEGGVDSQWVELIGSCYGTWALQEEKHPNGLWCFSEWTDDQRAMAETLAWEIPQNAVRNENRWTTLATRWRIARAMVCERRIAIGEEVDGRALREWATGRGWTDPGQTTAGTTDAAACTLAAEAGEGRTCAGRILSYARGGGGVTTGMSSTELTQRLERCGLPRLGAWLHAQIRTE